MIEVEDTDVNIVRNLIPMRNHMPASAYGLKAISDWFFFCFQHPKESTNSSKSITTGEHFSWTKKKTFSKETFLTPLWRINLTKLFYQKLCKSKILADLAEPNILIWLTKILHSLMQLGAKRVPII